MSASFLAMTVAVIARRPSPHILDVTKRLDAEGFKLAFSQKFR
jgi:hypothetical protein